MKFKTILFLFFALNASIFAQNGITLLSNFNYGAGFPGGDLVNRFGFHQTVGVGVELMSNEKNWILGADLNYSFGKKVKEDPLAKFVNYNGYIYGADKELSIIFLRERGFILQGYVGRLIPFSSAHKRKGLRLTFGAGYMQHKIRLQDDSQTVSQVSGDYKKGYDRLTGGLVISEFVGYQYLSENRRINFTVGFDFAQGFTKSKRDWDFDLKSKNTDKRLDLISGLRATWILPFYIGSKGENDEY